MKCFNINIFIAAFIPDLHFCIFAVRPNSSDFLNIFTGNAPLLDVRAEVEFAKGAFPNSVNIPILDDEQRRLVGTCFKEQGPEAAFDMGHDLMTPEIQAQRIHDWTKFAEANPFTAHFPNCSFKSGNSLHSFSKFANLKDFGWS